MNFAELAQSPEGAVALFGTGKGDDAVWRPFVWSQDGRFRVLADEGQLCEVMVLLW
jgi:hypothetical protein